MGFDFIVAVVTVAGVRKTSKDGLAALLRRQGIGYLGLILMVHTATVVGIVSFRRLKNYLTTI